MKQLKKYRLIREYPLSPELETIVYLETEDNYMTNMENDFKLFPKKIVENYPEFWELIVEYPIGTKVHNSQTNTIYTKKEDGWYKPSEKTGYNDKMIIKSHYINIIEDKVVEKDYEILSLIEDKFIYPCDKYSKDYINQLFNTLGVSIHSVKRKDGEIFTIGDKIQLDNDNKEFGTITELYISHEQLRFYCGRLGGVICHDVDKRNNFTKLKQKLFTTEDGVDIFEGDKYYPVCEYFNLHNECIYPSGHKMFKLFSTKEKAEEYILYNKPCLSLNDLKNLGIFNETDYCKRMWITIKELVNLKNNKK